MDIQSIFKSYGVGPLRQAVIEDCSFSLEAGKLTVLIGPSGCGKTILINILAGYEHVDAGSVSIDGEPIKGPGWDRLVVFQETALFPWMTTLENVIYGPLVRREKDRKELTEEALALLKKVGLSEFKDKYPTQLSGGMQRRAELVRALINTPKVMFSGLLGRTGLKSGIARSRISTRRPVDTDVADPGCAGLMVGAGKPSISARAVRDAAAAVACDLIWSI